MATYSVTQAARAVGRDRSSIRRAIAAGRISAVRDEASGEWRIEAAELHRIYPPTHTPGAERGAHQGDAPPRPSASDMRLAVAEARLADALDQNADLRRRLDTATAQLGEALQQVRALTDQRAKLDTVTNLPPAPVRRSWWRWGRRA
jgi:excisionase family DNA binding protein